ncbi:hypothetical protein [Paractinoplanes rishiriensis]|uniref:Uncharacterized protein n=1 Tax=Paractinoplanes rishiriensis TaxID=1050105 RepID=A0A919K3W3_9ACTN|nr:hypothetical protein [Actinoplanes rishiriensis]GIF00427.1 hypothetical protein Ari01nite_78910 [Actinoplanes rishiriensis]
MTGPPIEDKSAGFAEFRATVAGAPGEKSADWWDDTGYQGAEGLSELQHFYNGVPAEIVAQAAAHGREQVSAEWNEPWPPDAWPDVPTGVLVARDDQFFLADFQRRVAADRASCRTRSRAATRLRSATRNNSPTG